MRIGGVFRGGETREVQTLFGRPFKVLLDARVNANRAQPSIESANFARLREVPTEWNRPAFTPLVFFASFFLLRLRGSAGIQRDGIIVPPANQRDYSSAAWTFKTVCVVIRRTMFPTRRAGELRAAGIPAAPAQKTERARGEQSDRAGFRHDRLTHRR